MKKSNASQPGKFRFFFKIFWNLSKISIREYHSHYCGREEKVFSTQKSLKLNYFVEKWPSVVRNFHVTSEIWVKSVFRKMVGLVILYRILSLTFFLEIAKNRCIREHNLLQHKWVFQNTYLFLKFMTKIHTLLSIFSIELFSYFSYYI